MASTVVIPVYNAAQELEACLESVAATVGSETAVIVIDDASTDEGIVPLIERFVSAGGPRWRFVRQLENKGFVATANLGMRLSFTDVVLLNSDTIVTPGWLERLAACLVSSDQIATATPWSNNGEITSIPNFCQANPVPSNLDEVAQAIADAGSGLQGAGGEAKYPDLPTAVGFCMAISKRAIDSLGLFDEAQFGLGYGEENDFSLRARREGFRNVLCGDVYVAHLGGRSFGPLGLKPDASSMQRLLERHPGYQDEVSAFIAADPLAAIREAVCSAVVDAGLCFE